MSYEIVRKLSINLPKGKSAFLWGARKTGKSTYLKLNFPQSLYFDLLNTDIFISLLKEPYLLREWILASKNKALLQYPIIIDEVQKVPMLLDEVHWLIENHQLQFILCGSSARKLKQGHANLLGGRAWRYEMFPLTSQELGDVDILKVVNNGLIPSHYLETQYKRSLKAYIQDYLKEEIMAEGIARNIPAFARFLDSMAYSHGELTNYSNIAQDCGVSSKTVQEYYQILVDTLLGSFVEPFSTSAGRQTISRAAKFYLFDTGVANALSKQTINEAKGAQFGASLEHFIYMELNAHRSYSELDYDINFWRTKTGLEVDFILARGEIAIEVKGSQKVKATHLKGLKAFKEEFNPRRSIIVCNEKQERNINGIEVIPWRDFLAMLWGGELL